MRRSWNSALVFVAAASAALLSACPPGPPPLPPPPVTVTLPAGVDIVIERSGVVMNARPAQSPPARGHAWHEHNTVTWESPAGTTLQIHFINTAAEAAAADRRNPNVQVISDPVCGGNHCTLVVPHIAHDHAKPYGYVAAVKTATTTVRAVAEVILSGGADIVGPPAGPFCLPDTLCIHLDVLGSSVVASPEPALGAKTTKTVRWVGAGLTSLTIINLELSKTDATCSAGVCTLDATQLTKDYRYFYDATLVTMSGTLHYDPEIVIPGM